jgi:small subunit ribosomal protein S9
VTSPDDENTVADTDAAQTLAEAADLPQDVAAEDLTDDVATDDVATDDTAADDTAAGDDTTDEVFGEIAPTSVFAPIDRPIQTVGRRKEAVVRVRLVAGSGKMTMNGKAFEEYFPNKVHQQLIREPLVMTERTEQFDVYATLHGGGTSGQAGALRLGLARALTEVDPEDRPGLKKAGFLTRDPRATERKKYGLKKARKAPQYSKR